MADSKITALPLLNATPDNTDELVIVNQDGGTGSIPETQRISVQNLLSGAGSALTVTDGGSVTESSVSQITVGTGLELVDDATDGHVTINSTVTDTNTTYDLDSAQSGANATLTLSSNTDPDDVITLAAGDNITLDASVSNQVSISSSIIVQDENTVVNAVTKNLNFFNAGITSPAGFNTVAVDVGLEHDDDPQLSANLDVQSNTIFTSTTNGNVQLDPNGTGVVEILGNQDASAINPGAIKINCEQNSHGITIKAPAHSTFPAGTGYTLTLPSAVGSANDFLQTDASGNLTWAAAGGGGSGTDLDGQLIDYNVQGATLVAGDHEGQVVFLGTDTLNTGSLYYWDGTNWQTTSNNAESTAKGPIGIALGVNSATNGVLLQGVYYPSSAPAGSAGSQLYLGASANLTATAPVTNGKILRVMGQNLDGTRILFQPSQDFIELGTPTGNITVVGQEVDFVTSDTAIDTIGEGEGTVVKIGSDVVVKGDVYYYGASGWAAANAGAEATTKGLVGVALDTTSATGMLTEGVIKLASTPLGVSPAVGDVLYLSTTNGKLTVDAPTGSTEYVRVMGYYLGSDKAYFSPSQDWIDIA
jgi:hypothetical protein